MTSCPFVPAALAFPVSAPRAKCNWRWKATGAARCPRRPWKRRLSNCARHRAQQRDAGLAYVTVGDFAFYDQMASHIQLSGCEPARFDFAPGQSPLSRYVTLARGGTSQAKHTGCSHGHAPFNDILPQIAAMDTDVITIETSRSDMELLTDSGQFPYPNEIGPSVYDIHSPQITSNVDIVRLLQKTSAVMPPAY